MNKLRIIARPRADTDNEMVELQDMDRQPYGLVHSDLFWPSPGTYGSPDIYHKLQDGKEVVVMMEISSSGPPLTDVPHAALLESIVRDWEPGNEGEAKAVDELLEWLDE